MKKVFIRTFMTVAALTAQPALASSSSHDHSPKHGGVVTETKAADFELVATPGTIALYARNHDGTPMDVSKATAKVTLLTGGKKSAVELKPAGNQLQADGAFEVIKGTNAVALVTLPGKNAISVQFKLK